VLLKPQRRSELPELDGKHTDRAWR